MELATIQSILDTRKGTLFVGLVTQTSPRVTVKHRDTRQPLPADWRDIEKVTTQNVAVGTSYGAAVNRQRDREGVADTFDTGPIMNGMESVQGYPALRYHPSRDTHYLAYQAVPNGHGSTVYRTASGVPLTADEVDTLRGYLPKPRKVEKQGVERDVIWRTVSIENIVSIKFNAHTYV